MIKDNPTRIILITILAIMIVTSAIPMAGSANNPSTADEYFDTFRSLDGTASFQEYEEYGTLQTYATTRIQEISTFGSAEQQEMAAILQTMESFDSAYEEYQSDNFEQSIDHAQTAENGIESLSQYDETQASIAELGLNRLYEDIAQAALDEADQTDSTPKEVELLLLAAAAYEGAENTDEAAQFRLEAERLEAEYNSAIDQIEEAESETTAYVASCQDCNSLIGVFTGIINPIAIFSEYDESQQAVSTIQIAQEAVETHGLEDRGNQVEAVSDDVRSIWISLMAASSIIVIMYGLVAAIITAILFDRIFAWRNTFAASRVDSVVQMGGANV